MVSLEGIVHHQLQKLLQENFKAKYWSNPYIKFFKEDEEVSVRGTRMSILGGQIEGKHDNIGILGCELDNVIFDVDNTAYFYFHIWVSYETGDEYQPR